VKRRRKPPPPPAVLRLVARPRDIEIGNAHHVQAGGEPRLRQKHGAELRRR